jgi:hypothetical protein
MKLRCLALVAAFVVSSGTYAADTKPEGKPRTAQQSKMATCNKEAVDKKGDERKAFMKECLSKQETQQTKMKRCNVEAKGKTGEDRKQFMSECLKGSPKA